MSNNDWYLTLLSAPIPTILWGLQLTPLWLGADTPSRKNRCMRWCIDLDVYILCTRMCDVSDYSLKIYQLQYTSYCHYCNSPPWSRVDTWSRLSSACTIWLCHRLLWCASTMLLRNANEVYEIDTSLHLSHYQCHLFCPSSYHPFKVARVQQDEAHNMSHPSSWSICWWCWCIVVFCIIPSAETQDFLRSWSLHQWSPVIVYLIDLSINNTVSMLRSSLYLFQHHIAG